MCLKLSVIFLFKPFAEVTKVFFSSLNDVTLGEKRYSIFLLNLHIYWLKQADQLFQNIDIVTANGSVVYF